MNFSQRNTSADSCFADGGVLVVSPVGVWRDRVIEELDGREHPVAVATGGADALQKLHRCGWKTLLIEQELPDLDAYEVAEMAIRQHPGLQVRFLSSSTKPATDMSGAGGNTPIRFGCARSEAVAAISRGPLHSYVEPLPGMVGASEPMLKVYDLARRIARRTTTVLISGATGTGKEVVARAIHQLSARAGRPFVAINCAAIPEALLESELFGYSRGAFTGAVQSQAGRVLAAKGGTLFLDEVGEMPLSIQAKLLRFIELKEIQRLGGGEVSRADVRLVAATHHDLGSCVAARSFREDLFYRLAVFCVTLPPLLDRAGDIIPLARHFLSTAAQCNPAELVLSEGAIRKLMSHNWPGNVRELQLVMERASILAEGEAEILPEHISFPHLEQASVGARELRRVAV